MAKKKQKNEPIGGEYGSLKSYQMRIGDTLLYVAPVSIKVQRLMQTQQIPMLRGRGTTPDASGYAEKQVSMSIFFPDERSVNEELRALIAQVTRFPFLPVENKKLNEADNIHALAITDYIVQPIASFPGAVQLTIRAYAFDAASYIWNGDGLKYAEQFNWPLFRWHYQRALQKTEGVTYLRPALAGVDNSVRLEIASESDLIAVREWRKQRDKMIKDWIKEKSDKTGIDWEDIGFGNTNKAKEKKFRVALDEHYKKMVRTEDVRYEPWTFGDAFLVDMSVTRSNQIAKQTLQAQETPLYQYLGASDATVTLTYRVVGDDSAGAIEDYVTRANYLAREYSREKVGSVVKIDSALTGLFGIDRAVIADHQVTTVEGHPGVSDITLVLYGYSRAERRAQELQALTLGEKWKPQNYFGDGDLLFDFASVVGTLFNRPFAKDIADTVLGWTGMFDFIEQGGLDTETGELRGRDEIKQAVYDHKVMQTFDLLELYPDLELPTYGQVKRAGFDIRKRGDNVYVDPDFFINYPSGEEMRDALKRAMRTGSPATAKDAFGGKATVGKNHDLEMNEEAKKQAAKAKKITGLDGDIGEDKEEMSALVKQAKEYGKKHPVKKADFEIVTRVYAERFGLNGRHIMAFSKAMNPDLDNYGPRRGTIDWVGMFMVPVPKKTSKKDDILINNAYGIALGMERIAGMLRKVKSRPEKDIKAMQAISGNDITEEQASYLIAFLMHLGHEKDLDKALKSKKLPAELEKKRSAIESKMKSTKSWKKSKLEDAQEKMKRSELSKDGMSVHMNTYEQLSIQDPQAIQDSMFTDMLEYDQRGRMVRAFPTFMLTFIDEGKYVGALKLSDQFFRYQAVSSLLYTNSRKTASSTLTMELSNVFGSLTDASKTYDLGYASMADVFLNVLAAGSMAERMESSRSRNANYYSSIYLRTGARVHLRMGYGSAASKLPTIMNGTITSIQENGGQLTVVAQDDGIELTRKLIAEAGDDTSGFLTTKKEPMEIIDEILTDSKGFFKNIWAGISNVEMENHSLGIMHFGRQGRPQGVSDFTNLLSKAMLFGWVFPPSREITEINMNIHPTTGLTQTESDTWWSKIADEFGMGKADEANINMSLFDKTPWDVASVAASIAPDYVLAVHPFGFRNTLFLGKPYYPLAYGYDVKGDEVQGVKVKTFRQMHYYDSYTSILSNDIQATEENMYTVAVGMYQDEGEVATTRPFYVDTDIWPEKQKTMNVDTMLNARGMWLTDIADGIPLIGDLLNKPQKYIFDEGVASRIAAAALRDSVKDMYDGYLMVTGDGAIKPYDQVALKDTVQDMNGVFEVKEVNMIMNQNMGFVTMIKPDVIAVNSDKQNISFIMGVLPTISAVGSYMMIRKLLSHTRFAGNTPILNMTWGASKFLAKRSLRVLGYDVVKEKAKKYIDDKKVQKNEQERTVYRKNTGPTRQHMKHWIETKQLDDTIEILDLSQGEIEDLLKNTDMNHDTKRWLRSMKMDTTRMEKMFDKTTSFLGRAGKKGATAGKWSKNALRSLMAAQAFAGPVGWAAAAFEMVAYTVVSTTIGEFIERFLASRQAVLISPMKKSGLEFSAGINGHKGSVIGDDEGFVQSFLTSEFGAFTMGMLGVDTDRFFSTEGEIVEVQADNKAKKPSAKEEAHDLKRYYKDLESLNSVAQREIEKRDERFNMKPDYGSEWSKNGLQKLVSWFDGLKDAIADLVSGDDDSAGCGKEAPPLVLVETIMRFETSGRGSNTAVYDNVSATAGMSYGIFQMIVLKNCKEDTLHAFVRWLKNKDKEVYNALHPHLNTACYDNSAFKKAWIAAAKKYKKRFDELQIKYMKAVKWPMIYDPIKKQIKVDLNERSWAIQAAAFSRITQHGPRSAVRCFTETYREGISDKEWIRKIYDKSYSIAAANGANLHSRLKVEEPKMLLKMLEKYKDNQSASCGDYSCDGRPKAQNVERDWRNYKLRAGSGKDMVALNGAKKEFSFVNVGGSPYLRKASLDSLNKVARAFNKKYGMALTLTSTHRPEFPDWHSTGYAIDIDTPNTMRSLPGGSFGFSNKKEVEKWTWVVDQLIDEGWDWFIFGDKRIIDHAKKRGAHTWWKPDNHADHLHVSVPLCKKNKEA